MSLIRTVEKYTDLFVESLRKRLVYYSELQNIKLKRPLIDSVKLSSCQEKEICDFFAIYYGKKIKTHWHKLYQSYTGEYHYDYFPEYLFSTELEPKLNPYRFAAQYGDKNLLHKFFGDIQGLHVPHTFLACSRGVLYTGDNKLVSHDCGVDLLKNIGDCVIKKTIDTSSGRDVQICYFANGIDLKTGKDISTVLSYFGSDFVVQEKIKQCEFLNCINPNSVNTFRVITYILENKIYVCPIALRFGRSNTDRDNLHSGGLGIGITKDGTLRDRAFSEFGESYAYHPDTHFKFSNQLVKYGERTISDIHEMAKKLHSRLPFLGILSWDLTIDDDNLITLLEVNTVGQGVWLNQLANGLPLFGQNTSKILSLLTRK